MAPAAKHTAVAIIVEFGPALVICALALTANATPGRADLPIRNPATHGASFDIGTAEAIRADWFNWEQRSGGIFSVLFRNE